jgi:hypothetical protein
VEECGGERESGMSNALGVLGFKGVQDVVLRAGAFIRTNKGIYKGLL